MSYFTRAIVITDQVKMGVERLLAGRVAGSKEAGPLSD